VLDAIEKGLQDRSITIDNLFDRNYIPVPNSSPQKFTTRFDTFFDRVISPFQEMIVSRDPKVMYAICIDNNGYCPCHNLRFSKPLTGNLETDRNNNRTKRKFDDRTGLRCGSSTEPFLLQTYARDTGEFINDISAPINVCGKHWGGVRLGYSVDD